MGERNSAKQHGKDIDDTGIGKHQQGFFSFVFKAKTTEHHNS